MFNPSPPLWSTHQEGPGKKTPRVFWAMDEKNRAFSGKIRETDRSFRGHRNQKLGYRPTLCLSSISSFNTQYFNTILSDEKRPGFQKPESTI
jgi:hypothetical protein